MAALRLLILNWRDPRHPQAGGAEFLTHEVARRLVAQGDQVEWFSASFPGANAEENLDGVRILRAGRQWTVHWHAFQRYRGKMRDRFDAVIDEVNTLPFLTPLWAGIPTFLLIFQLAREVWWHESRLPLSAMGFAAEPMYLRCYRRVPTFTISESTKRDLRHLGFSSPITILPVGVEPITESAGPKPRTPTFLYVGRLAPSKRITDIVQAFGRFRQMAGPAQLWLVGDGPARYKKVLRRLVDRLGLAREVSFLGRLSSLEKHQRMATAHMLLMASVREGWGMVVTEANACRTPAVVYDVPGLRDAVRHEQTGLIVEPYPAKLADGMLRLWDDQALYGRLVAEAWQWSQCFSFDQTATTIRNSMVCSLTQ